MDLVGVEEIITKALRFARDFKQAYAGSPDILRRKFNQTFFRTAVASQAFTSRRYQRAVPEPVSVGVGLCKVALVEVRGVEPLTSAVRRQRSTTELHPQLELA